MPLNDIQIRKAVPGVKAVRMFDGGGLYLEVRPTGGKWWRFKFRYGGKEKLLALGTYPEVPLKAARDRRDAARRDLQEGVDPSEARKAKKATRGASPVDSFEAVAREWHGVKKSGWSPRHAAVSLRRLEMDAFPVIGDKSIGTITAPQLLGMVRRIEARGAVETARTVMRLCGQVFRYGIPTGRCDRNPAADLRDALQPVVVTHMGALTDPREVGVLMRAIADYQGHPVTRAALVFSALVFQRPGNVRAADWSEIDFERAVWSVPSEKMKRTLKEKKNGRPHVVPLSTQAVAELRDLYKLTGPGGRYLFPSLLSGERCMSENTVNTALRRMGFERDAMSAHGFRAMARTILAERLGVPPDVIEAQLAHVKSAPLGSAYDRAEFLEQRREMMQKWADYLDTLRKGADVIPLRE